MLEKQRFIDVACIDTVSMQYLDHIYHMQIDCSQGFAPSSSKHFMGIFVFGCSLRALRY